MQDQQSLQKNLKIGAIGPTTSERMDEFLEMLYYLGVIATIGKGKRSNLAVELCKKNIKEYTSFPPQVEQQLIFQNV